MAAAFHSRYRRADELNVILLIPSDGREPQRIGCDHLSDISGADNWVVASRRQIPSEVYRPWDEPLDQPRHRDDPDKWVLDVRMGSSDGTPGPRGRAPPSEHARLSLPQHVRYPDMRGDVFVACFARNRLTSALIEIPVTEDDVAGLMGIVDAAYLGFYSLYVSDFDDNMGKYAGLGCDALLFKEQARLVELGHLVKFWPNHWERWQYLPPTPADAEVAIKAIEAQVALFQTSAAASDVASDAADELLTAEVLGREQPSRASMKTADQRFIAIDEINRIHDARVRDKVAEELLEEEARALALASMPSRSSLKKKRMRMARAAKKASQKTAIPSASPAQTVAADQADHVDPVTDPVSDPVALPFVALPSVALQSVELPVAPVESIGPDSECTICNDGPRNTVFMPCAHVCCCMSCAVRFKSCPYCCATITSSVRIYIV